jgi:HK97 family phage portal protein
MWPFDRLLGRKRERAVVTLPGDWITNTNSTGNPWGSLATDAWPISPHAAENIAAVGAAVNAIAGTIASLPAYVVMANDSRAEVPEHPLQRLIDGGVNDSQTWSDFIEALMGSTLLQGNALADVEADDYGRLRALHLMPWPQVQVQITEKDRLVFDYRPINGARAGQVRRYGRDDVLHLADRSDDGYVGVSRLSRARGALQLALDLQGFSAAFLNNAARPGGTLKTTTNIGDDMKRRLKEEWDIAFRVRGEYGKVAILPAGTEYAPLSQMSAEDQQIVNHRNFSVSDIARVFGVPPHILADPSRSTFASAREASRQFATQTLAPWVSKLQRAFAMSVLSSQYRLIIDLGDLLRADPEARWASWQRARAAGVLSPNDVRTEEGWPASDDPTADSIEPPVAGGRPADGAGDDAASTPPAPSSDATDEGADKVARLDHHRARHGSD